MKIFVFAPEYPNDENSTENSFIREQVNALFECGNSITVLHAKVYPTSKLFTQIDYQLKSVKDKCAIRYIKPMKSFLYKVFPRKYAEKCENCFKELFEAAVDEQGFPDIIYAHFSCYAGYSACKIAETHKIPVVTIEHGGYFLTSNVGKWQLSCLKYSLIHSKRFICVSEGQKNVINKLCDVSADIKVVQNIIDERFIYTPLPENNSFIFFSVANLYKGKRIEMLVRAFCDEFTADDNVHLKICGDGEERKRIENIISKSKREKDVTLLGRLDRDKVIQEYKGCNCFVLPSDHETFGIVYREALCMGIPIITTNHLGFSDAEWNEKMGLRIPIGDYDALKRSLRFMYKNAKQYNRRQISNMSLALYSRENVKQNLNNILLEACEKKDCKLDKYCIHMEENRNEQNYI